ncbi:mitochondrial cytochrome-like protein b2 [Phaeosphaeria sp. MPI-PUGE-AT-0046c]|nr:mitochondrial cytochrome-like protein b2 [Phaeosphaeria sp. MPI-PUGE-AT-0046c]
MAKIDGAEVARHNTKKSCWLVLDSRVYNVTSFQSDHPGGTVILLKNAGTDATTEFKKYHPLTYVKQLPPGSDLGPIDPNTLAKLNKPKETTSSPVNEVDAENKIPHVSLCVSCPDFERVAKSVLPHKFYIYASTSANYGLSLKGNLEDWDASRKIFGDNSPYPFYISPMGTLGTINSEAELDVVRGAVKKGVHMAVSTASTRPTTQIADCHRAELQRHKGSPTRLFFQYYMPVDRTKAIELMHIVKEAGYKGLWITVDTPVLGKRTADRVLQAEEALAVGMHEEPTSTWETGDDNAFAPAMGGRPSAGQLSPHTTWEDLSWIHAKLALEYGVDGILLSNYRGRQLHTAPSSLMTLLEIRTYYLEVIGRLEIFMDGGLRDGAEVLKALCLGATAVGVGRPYMYAFAAYWGKGLEKVTDILAEELTTGMRLLGITSLDQLKPEMVNASRLLNEMWRPDSFSVRSKL